MVPTSPITSRPIDNVEPYTMHNGKMVHEIALSGLTSLLISLTGRAAGPGCRAMSLLLSLLS